jgi:hypothetical protein
LGVGGGDCKREETGRKAYEKKTDGKGTTLSSFGSIDFVHNYGT